LKTILIFADWYTPGYKAGGPVQSVYNLAQLLSKYFIVRVVTTNKDLNSSEPYPDIEPNAWIMLDKNHFVQYLNQDKLNRHFIKQLINENRDNVILINGLFSFYFSVLPVFYSLLFKNSRTFIAVRGMLHKSALSVKPLKKQIFIAFARGFGLYKHAVLLSTNDQESIEIARIFGGMKINIAPNIPLLPKNYFLQDFNFKGSDKMIRLLFLGRISPEKNPLVLLEALNKMRSPCHVTFCGSSNNPEYFSKFMEKLGQLPQHIKYKYIPDIPHAEIGSLLSATDVMVMPSLGENFGHAIFESFVHSVPVIIGNNTPWTGIEVKFAGIEVNPSDSELLLLAVEKFVAMDEVSYNLWREGAFNLSKAYFEENNFDEIYLKLFS